MALAWPVPHAAAIVLPLPLLQWGLLSRAAGAQPVALCAIDLHQSIGEGLRTA